MGKNKMNKTIGSLYVVATPIGNLKDITLRALETLKKVDIIFAEDTRVTQKLLNHYEIKKPVKSFHEHSKGNVYESIAEELKNGKNIALVTDAGTPGISDPGAKLICFIKSHPSLSSVIVSPIPGASAIITALSVSGLNADQFTFLGYPPHKKGRQTFFKNLKEIKVTPIVLYESPHRLQKTLKEIGEVFGMQKEVIVAKELTKIHEEVWQGSVKEAGSYFINAKGKGEFVIIIPHTTQTSEK